MSYLYSITTHTLVIEVFDPSGIDLNIVSSIFSKMAAICKILAEDYKDNTTQ